MPFIDTTQMQSTTHTALLCAILHVRAYMHISPFPSQVLPFDNVVQINYVEEEHT